MIFEEAGEVTGVNDPIVLTALERLNHCGHEAYLVGGFVRDLLMGRKTHDIDIATSAVPDEICKVFSGFHVIPTGIAHGTVTVMIEGVPVEITTFRTEKGYSDNRHPDKVEFTSSLKADLSRRDFTMNAVAMDVKGKVIDPFAGQKDIRLGVIRCVGEPEKRFCEDSLRILRALRFSSELGFNVEERTEKAIFSCASLLKSLSAERVCAELSRLVCGKNAADVLLKYGRVLAVVLPCISKMIGFEQHNYHHCFDVYEHCVNAVKHVRPVVYMRLAALLHDCEKPSCFSLDESGVGHFYGHAPKSAELAREQLKRLRFDNETVEKVTELIRIHDSPIECDIKTVKRKLNRLGRERFFDLVELQRADNLAQAAEYRFRQANFDELENLAKEVIEEDECFSLKKLAVNGHDMLKLGLFGKEVGETLDYLLNCVIDGSAENEREELLSKAQSKIKNGFKSKK